MTNCPTDAPPGTPVLTGYWAKEYALLRAENERLRAAAQAVIDSINDENEIDSDAIANLSRVLSA